MCRVHRAAPGRVTPRSPACQLRRRTGHAARRGTAFFSESTLVRSAAPRAWLATDCDVVQLQAVLCIRLRSC